MLKLLKSFMQDESGKLLRLWDFCAVCIMSRIRAAVATMLFFKIGQNLRLKVALLSKYIQSTKIF